MSFDYNEMTETVQTLLHDLLRDYEERVPEEGVFPDLRVGRMIQFGDPAISSPGRIELVVMNMDARLDPAFHYMRFVSVQVMKSREGGYVAVTCFHGRKEELRVSLSDQITEPDFLIDRISELADGLPEETNPDIWR